MRTSRNHVRRRSCLLPALLALALGCDEDSEGCSLDDCAGCQNALDHMQEKAEQFGCNPAFMENARDKIVEECDGHNPYKLVGMIVEECQSGVAPTVSCHHPFPVRMAFDFFIDPAAADLYPDGVRFRVRLFAADASVVDDGEFLLDVGETHRLELEIFNEGSLFVEISDPDDPEGELAFNEDQVFVKETDEQWANYQFRTAVASESADGLPIIEMLNF